MNLLDQLRNLAAALPSIPGGPWIVCGDYIEQVGDVHYGAPDDNDCDCDVDPDAAQPVLVLLPIASAADLFEEAIRRHGNGAGKPEDIAWDMARSLELGGEVA